MADQPGRGWKFSASLFACVGIALVLIGGCSTATNINRRVADEVRATAAEQAQVASEKSNQPSGHEPLTLEALIAEVIHADHDFRIAQGDLRLAGVQLTEAHRAILPRFMARGFFEMPITESGVDTVFSGGVYLRFDLIRACLSRNAVTVAEVTREARREKCRTTAAAASHAFFNCLSQVEFFSQAISNNQAASRLAILASTEAEALFKAGRLAADRWQAWEQRRAEKDVELQRLTARLQKARGEATRAYRNATADETTLLELSESFSKRLAAPPENSSATLAETLEESPPVVEARLGMFLAEMGILDAKLKRLPSVSLDVGAGQIPVQGDRWRKESGVVPMAEVTMPLLDMGDISRAIKRAKISAEQAREKMIRAVEASRLNIESTRQELSAATTALATAERLRVAASARQNETRELFRAGTATALDSHEAAWMVGEAEATANQAQQDYRLALLAERAARGVLLDEDLQKEIFSKLACREKWDIDLSPKSSSGK